MSANDVLNILVFVLGGTMVSVGKPLDTVKTAEELSNLFRDYWNPKHMRFLFYRLQPKPFDSGNVSVYDLIEAAFKIRKHYQKIDGVIIISGTGRAARATAGLSLIFRDSLQKPVLVTGSLLSPEEPGSDAPARWVSICRAMDGCIQNRIKGVHWVWGNNLLHGARLLKVSDVDEPAFITPGRLPLAKILDTGFKPDPSVATYKDPNWDQIPLEFHARFSRRIHSEIGVTVDDDPWLLKTMASSRKYDGVILNVPDLPSRSWSDHHPVSWLSAVEYAVNKGMFIGLAQPWQPCDIMLSKYKLGDKAQKAGAWGMLTYTPAMAEMVMRQACAEESERARRIEFMETDHVGGLLSAISRQPTLSVAIS